MPIIQFQFHDSIQQLEINENLFQTWEDFKNLFYLKFNVNKNHDIYCVLLDENKKVCSSIINDAKKFWTIYQSKYCINAKCSFEVNVRQPLIPSNRTIQQPSLNNNVSVHKCCQDGNFELLQEIVRDGAHINARDENSSSPLHYAALNGYLPIVKFLIAQKAFKNNKNSSGQTPFLCASMNGHLEVVKYLVDEKVFTFAVDDAGNSALHLAAQGGHHEVIKWLIQNNIVDSSIRNRSGQTYQDIIFPRFDSTSGSIPESPQLTYLPCRLDGHMHSVDVAISISTLTWESLCCSVLKACLPNFENSAVVSSLVDYAILLEEDGDEGSGKIDDTRKFMKVFTKIYKQNSRMTFLFVLSDSEQLRHMAVAKASSPPIIENTVHNLADTAEPDFLEDELELEQDPDPRTLSRDLKSNDVLCSACERGDFVLANELVLNGCNVNYRDGEFKTPLHYASERGHLQICSMLISNNAFKNGKDRKGRTPLLGASLNGHLEVVQYLIQIGCFTFVVDDDSNGILHLAALSGSHILVDWIRMNCDIEEDLSNNDGKTYIELLDVTSLSTNTKFRETEPPNLSTSPSSPVVRPSSPDIPPFVPTISGQETNKSFSLVSQQATEALLNACFSGDFAVASRLLSMSDVNCYHQSSLTPLHFSCHFGNFEFTEALLCAGANPNLQDRKGMTPLHYSCQNRDVRLIAALFRYGAAFVSDDRGYNPFHLAAIAGDDEIFKLLANQGGDLDEIDNLGNSPLFYLIEGKHIDLATWVVDNFSPNIYLTNLDNLTPIDVARNFGFVEFCTLAISNHQKRELHQRVLSNTTALAKCLLNNDWKKATDVLSRPIDPDLMVDGTHLLHICCRLNCEDIFNSLLRLGADINILDSESMTPLMSASRSGNFSLVSTLVEKHADISRRDHRGWTALFFAVSENHLSVAKLLYAISNSLESDLDGNTILHVACAHRSIDCLSWLISNAGLLLSDDTLNNAGETALGIARRNNFLEILSLSDQQLISRRFENSVSFAKALLIHDVTLALSLCKTPPGVNPNAFDGTSGKILFHLACELGNVEIVKILLDQGASITLEGPNGRNAIESACLAGQLEIIRWLKKIGSSLDKFSSEGLSPFHYACLSGNLPTVRWLIDRGVRLKVDATDSSSALHFACASGNKELVVFLIAEHQFDTFQKNQLGLLPIDFAAKEGSVEVVLWLSRKMNLSDNNLIPLKSQATHVRKRKLLLEHQLQFREGALLGDLDKIQVALEFGINIDAEGDDGTSALHLACSSSKLDCIKYLVEKGANINCKTKEGVTPLHIAAKKGHTEIFEYLLLHGANSDELDLDGNDILILSATSQTPDLTKLIVSRFPLFNECRRNRLGVSAIVSAVSNGNFDLAVWFSHHTFVKRQQEVWTKAVRADAGKSIEEMISKSIDLNIADQEGISPLHILSQIGNYGLVQRAINFGANENAVDNKYRTPLHLAAECGNTEIVKYLCDMRADLGATDDFGMTPLLYACKRGHLLTVAYLVGQGAKITTSNLEGSDALHLACESGDISLVKWLCESFEIPEDQPNIYFKSPSDIASEGGYFAISSYLEKRRNNREIENQRIQQELQEAEIERQRILANLEAIRQEEILRESKIESERLRHLAEEIDIETRANELLRAVATQQLLEFSQLGRRGEILQLLQGDVDVNCCDSQHWTPLHFACQSKSIEIVEALIRAGAEVNSVTLMNETPLLIAMRYHGGDSNIFWCLFSSGAKLDIESTANLTPLHYICEAGNYQLWCEIFCTKLSFSSVLLENLLRHSARLNQKKILSHLLDMNIDPDSRDILGFTPLHLSCEAGWQDSARTLLDAGASVDPTDKEGRTPLMLAIISDSVELVFLLVEYHASLFSIDHNGNTPLHYACRVGNIKIASFLIQRGADIYSQNVDGKMAYDLSSQSKSLAHLIRNIIEKTTEILDICANGDNEGLLVLLKKKYDITCRDKHRLSGLHLAAQNGHIEICRTLLRGGVHVDTSDCHGRTPISYACSSGQLEVAQFLLDQGADLQHTSSDGRTYLHWAVISDSAPLLQWILQFFLDCNVTAEDNYTPLHDAAAHNCVRTIKILLDRGAIVTNRTFAGLTAFSVACKYNHFDAAELLLAKPHCSDIDSRDNTGCTSFLQACIENRFEMVEWLYSLGTNYLTTTNIGDTALHFAAQTQNVRLAEWLMLKGLDTSVVNNAGETPVHIASKTGNMVLLDWMGSQPTNPVSQRISLIRELEVSLEKGNVALIAALFKEVCYLIKQHIQGTYLLSTLCCAAATLNELNQIDIFLRNGAHISSHSSISRMTPLHYACRYGCLDMVHHLIAKGAEINAQDLKGRTPLDISIEYEQRHIVDVLRLLEASSNTNVKNVESTLEISCNPFLYACLTEDLPQVKALTDNSKDLINYQSEKSKLTPLHVCIIHKPNEEVINYLLLHGANPNLLDSNGYSPLQYACELLRDPAVIISLIKYKGSLTLLSANGISALHIICKRDLVDLMGCILDLPRSILKNLNLNVVDISNRNILHVAVDVGSLSMCHLLLRQGVLVNHLDNHLSSPLHLAVSKKHYDIIKLLLEHGADPNLKDSSGRTPLSISILDLKDLNISRLLNQFGADITVTFEEGDTFLHVACRNGNVELAKWLVRSGLNPSAENEVGKSPVELAHLCGKDDLLEWLLAWIVAAKVDRPVEVILAEATGASSLSCDSPSLSEVSYCEKKQSYDVQKSNMETLHGTPLPTISTRSKSHPLDTSTGRSNRQIALL